MINFNKLFGIKSLPHLLNLVQPTLSTCLTFVEQSLTTMCYNTWLTKLLFLISGTIVFTEHTVSKDRTATPTTIYQKLMSELTGKCATGIRTSWTDHTTIICPFDKITQTYYNFYNMGYFVDDMDSYWSEDTNTLTMPNGDYCSCCGKRKTEIQFVCSSDVVLFLTYVKYIL